jgi:tetratricopeptide (TPR) repeat protein
VNYLLGQGGQKQVYLARDTRLDREVVIALLKTDQLQPKGVARLQREAQAMARLGDHPNIVTVHDIGEEDGRPYIVSQYVQGGSVAEMLAASGKKPLPIDQALRITSQVCRALAHSHAKGIIHRDVKPGNVWITEGGTAKLGDFGVAFDLSQLTVEGSLVGTVIYMPPECAMGEPASPRSDLYSLGVMLYEMVTGRPPFQGDLLSVILSQHINTPPVAPSFHNPEIPQALEGLILRLLSKSPDGRPSSAGEVQRELVTISAAPASGDRLVPQDAKSLARLAGGVFVGREKEMAAAVSALNETRAGRGRLLMLVGEPGSGKSALAGQLATYARVAGSEVLRGRCYEGEGAPAFWLWIQIVRQLVRERNGESLASLMGPGGADIAQIAPEIRERFPELPLTASVESDQARFRLFDSLTTFLKNAAKVRPLVLILDDLHWADEASLKLLEFLASDLTNSRLLVVGAFRDIDLTRQHPLARTLGELTRQGMSERIVLRGISEGDVGRLIEMAAGIEPPPRLVAAVHKETEGNPFFVTEVVRLLVSEGRLETPQGVADLTIPIPQGVKEAVGRRLDHLSEECNRVLRVASVVGDDFTRLVLEHSDEDSGDQVQEALDEALAARVIREGPGHAGHYSFSHALIREILYGELSMSGRLRLHRRIGESLESVYRGSIESHLTELAHHFFQASAGGGAGKAINYGVRAALRAIRQMAYEAAAGHYERALMAVQSLERKDKGLECELLLALGDAQNRAGIAEEARRTFRGAADVAREGEFSERLALAALGGTAGEVMQLRFGRGVDQDQVDLLEEALGGLAEGNTALKVRLLAQLALALYYRPVERRLSLSQQAVEMARRVDDPSAKIAALYSRSVSLEGFDAVEERLELATEIVRVAGEAGDREMVLRGHYRRLRDLAELGDLPAVEQEIRIYSTLADESRQPRYLWLAPFWRSTRALLEGRFQECEQLARESLAIGKKAHDRNAELFFGTQMSTLGKLRGQYTELLVQNQRMADKYPSIPTWQASLAQIHARLGNRELARNRFEIFAQSNFSSLPRDGAWVVGMISLAEVCHFLGDQEHARTLYNLLAPFAGHNIIIGLAACFNGPVSHFLGLLAATMSRWEEAKRHFEEALDMARKMGARPFEAYTQHAYGAMLLEHDRAQALELLDAAGTSAKELGMRKLIEDLERLR